MTTEKPDFINIKDWMPKDGRNVILKTKYGVRRAVFGRFILGGAFLTDCTHPMENCHMSVLHIIGWKYENEQDYEDYPPTKITWIREKEANDILKQVSLNKKWYNNIFNFIKKRENGRIDLLENL